ncbi:MFS transporter [Thalassospira sp.]|uniref:MFS transporter n=1 Tax=Thalassospira sp. TaxID=1912094 RepID=UPI001B2195F2|nr:MFS transporter [Thalassospira sp.]MBO6808406.1 MFS transporter [Thalassospira sp.]MBO6839896.1 MFS transporter [Thalassospira sp.]
MRFDFRKPASLFFTSMFAARLADQFLLFVVPLVVYQTTQSVSLSGLAYAAETLPRVLFYPVCGGLSDRYSPLRLMQLSQIGRAVICVLGLIGFALFDGLGWVVGISAICGLLTTQGFMAREVLLPQIFASARFEKIQSVSQSVNQASIVLGPLLAATLFAISNWQTVVVVAAVLFAIAELSMMIWRHFNQTPISATDENPSWVAPFKTAFSHLISLPGLKRVIALTASVNLVFGITLATSAAMVTGLHGQSEEHYALLQTVGAAFTIIVLMLVGASRLSVGRIGLISFAGVFLGGVLTAISPDYWLYMVGFAVVLGFDGMFNIYIRTVRQKIIPARDYGKTTGVIILFNNMTQPIAGLLVGLTGSLAQTSWLILVLSLVMLVSGLVLSLPRFNVRAAE